jgi:hypothetical protein
MTETQIKNKIVNRLKALRKSGIPVWWCKIHGGPMQQAGVPDLVVIANGVTLWIELKQPGKKLSKLQEVTHKNMADAGAAVVVCYSLEQFDLIAKNLLRITQ